MSLKPRIALVVWCIVSLIIPLSAKADESHGPKNGYLLIGGSIGDPYRFIAMAGGSKARIVYIPTANIAKAGVVAKPGVGQDFCILATKLTGARCTVLHTDNRHIANSKAFVAPLKNATGVWITGGETWRLADAYSGTRFLTELFHVLDRGGVIAGNSAGAAIQASFLVRGASGPGREKIVIAPERQTGFGFSPTPPSTSMSAAQEERMISLP